MAGDAPGTPGRPFPAIPDALRDAAAARGGGPLSEDASLDERLAYVEAAILRERAAAPAPRRVRGESPLHKVMQDFVDGLFEDGRDEGAFHGDGVHDGSPRRVSRLDVVVAAESAELPLELLEIVGLLPPGDYSRARLCAQLNSAIGARAWGRRFGVIE